MCILLTSIFVSLSTLRQKNALFHQPCVLFFVTQDALFDVVSGRMNVIDILSSYDGLQRQYKGSYFFPIIFSIACSCNSHLLPRPSLGESSGRYFRFLLEGYDHLPFVAQLSGQSVSPKSFSPTDHHEDCGRRKPASP